MKKTGFLLSVLLWSCSNTLAQLTLLPQNPNYFSFKGKPAVLVGSTEHYGAVINPPFDYLKYLDAQAKEGLNLVRLFVGSYVEKLGAFGIQKNTLAPQGEMFLCPWKRSTTAGYVGGGNKFDLEQWDESYFVRLKDFVAQAQKRGIVVEVTLFSSYYGDQWKNSPLNAQNNINGVGNVAFNKANTLDNGNLLPHQERMVRKLVRELNGFDNLYYEIQNEPWADLGDSLDQIYDTFLVEDLKASGNIWRNRIEVARQVSLEWQAKIASFVTDEEAKLPQKHLISQNYCNFTYAIPEVNPQVSILNFHYALPSSVATNRHHQKVIGFNETGFAGRSDATYRRQLWRFLMAGGALFNHLDYSFSLGQEDGSDLTYQAPGGGSPALRKQFGVCKKYFDALPLPHLMPNDAIVKAATGAFAQALSAQNSTFVVYLEMLSTSSKLILQIPSGTYKASWLDTKTGEITLTPSVVSNGQAVLSAPASKSDWVLKLDKK